MAKQVNNQVNVEWRSDLEVLWSSRCRYRSSLNVNSSIEVGESNAFLIHMWMLLSKIVILVWWSSLFHSICIYIKCEWISNENYDPCMWKQWLCVSLIHDIYVGELTFIYIKICSLMIWYISFNVENLRKNTLTGDSNM